MACTEAAKQGTNTTYELVLHFQFYQETPTKSTSKYHLEILISTDKKSYFVQCKQQNWRFKTLVSLTRPYKKEKRYFGGNLKSWKLPLGKGVRLSPDKTEKTVSIFLRVKTLFYTSVSQSGRVLYESFERARCCQEPWQWRVRFWFVVRHFKNWIAGVMAHFMFSSLFPCFGLGLR